MQAVSRAFAGLDLVAPRTADAVFEAGRHASMCAGHLDTAEHALSFLRTLVASRAAPEPTRLDIEAHLRVIEQKATIYADLCATVDNARVSLVSAKVDLRRCGDALTRVMRDLRGLDGVSAAAQSLRRIVTELVAAYTMLEERQRRLDEALFDVLPAELMPRVRAVAH